MKIADAFVEISARHQQMKQAFDRATADARRTTSKIQARFNKLRAGLSSSFRAIGRAAKAGFAVMATAAAGAAAGLAAYTMRMAQTIDRQAKFARTVGATTQEIRALEFAADRSGVEQGALRQSLIALQKRLGEAAMGTGEAKAALDELGLSAEAMVNRPLAENIDLIADRLDKIESPATRAAVAAKLFSRQGVEFTRVLAGGSRALDSYREEFEKLNGTISEEQAAKVEAFNDAVTDLKAAFDGLLIDVAPGILDWFREIIEEVKAIIALFREWDGTVKGIIDILGQLAGITSQDTSLNPSALGTTDIRSESARRRIAEANDRARRNSSGLPTPTGDPVRDKLALLRFQREQREARALNPFTPGPGPPDGFDRRTAAAPGPGFFPQSTPLDRPLAAAAEAIAAATRGTTQTVSTAIGGFRTGTEDAVQRNQLNAQRSMLVAVREIRDQVVSGAGTSGAFT